LALASRFLDASEIAVVVACTLGALVLWDVGTSWAQARRGWPDRGDEELWQLVSRREVEVRAMLDSWDAEADQLRKDFDHEQDELAERAYAANRERLERESRERAERIFELERELGIAPKGPPTPI
jgi:hypothetical protein